METNVEITRSGKIVAGIVLVAFLLLPIVLIIGYWPNKLPAPAASCTSYRNKLFHVCLLDSSACIPCTTGYAADTVVADTQTIKAAVIDTTTAAGKVAAAGRDSAARAAAAARLKTVAAEKVTRLQKMNRREAGTIELSIILLILVAAGGFLGNMIHISSSFTAFVGAGKFKRSWLLWYCVKPFTAAALAVTVYFAFRAGFFSSGNDSSNINIYGIMTFAILTGLFTDSATQKLKEIFEVLFKPKNVLPDSLDNGNSGTKITSVVPDKIVKGKPNQISIMGQKLDTQKLTITINNNKVSEPLIVKPNMISFSYTIPTTEESKTEFILTVTDEKGKQIYTNKWTIA